MTDCNKNNCCDGTPVVSADGTTLVGGSSRDGGGSDCSTIASDSDCSGKGCTTSISPDTPFLFPSVSKARLISSSSSLPQPSAATIFRALSSTGDVLTNEKNNPDTGTFSEDEYDDDNLLLLPPSESIASDDMQPDDDEDEPLMMDDEYYGFEVRSNKLADPSTTTTTISTITTTVGFEADSTLQGPAVECTMPQEGLNKAYEEDAVTGEQDPWSIPVPTKLTKLSEAELLHQPHHGRQPSVIAEVDGSDEVEVSLKYSGGVDVLVRITSQQELQSPLFPVRGHSPSQSLSSASRSSSYSKEDDCDFTAVTTTFAQDVTACSDVSSKSVDTVCTHLSSLVVPGTIREFQPLSSSADQSTSANDSTATIQRQDDDVMNRNRTSPKTSFISSKQSTTETKMNDDHAVKDPVDDPVIFIPQYTSTIYLNSISKYLLPKIYYDAESNGHAASWIGFWGMLLVTCSNHIVAPMKDAIALQVGVTVIPQLTLASTVLAVFSSVPIGWLFEAPDPSRRLIFKRMGLTRGETQGTSLALFYRLFAAVLLSYAIGFRTIEFIINYSTTANDNENRFHSSSRTLEILDNHGTNEVDAPVSNGIMMWLYKWTFGQVLVLLVGNETSSSTVLIDLSVLWSLISQCLYIAFFLVVNLMKLHCLSLMWGVITEALEYEEESRVRQSNKKNNSNDYPQQQSTLVDSSSHTSNKINPGIMRLKRLSFIGFGGTLGGIMGSIIASILATTLQLPGLLVLSAMLLEISAQLSIELGRIMQKHWMKQQLLYLQKQQEEAQTNSGEHLAHNYNTDQYSSGGSSRNSSTNSFTNNPDSCQVDTSLRRSVSLGSMKRVASGNSLHQRTVGNLNANQVVASTEYSSSMNTPSDSVHTDGLRQRRTRSSSVSSATDSVNSLYNRGEGKEQGLNTSQSATSSEALSSSKLTKSDTITKASSLPPTAEPAGVVNDDTFRQRLLRGIYTIFRSRLLMAIFTYNALYASTNVLLSFERAALVANRNKSSNYHSVSGSTTNNSSNNNNVQADTAFLANINMASSIAIFALQASGIGASVAHVFGSRGTLSLMPLVRLAGVFSLAYWHRTSKGQPPNLVVFLVVDEFCKIMNLAIAKPVRESLWRGLSNEARYEAKPIVDTLANRWGGGSAAFLVAFVDQLLLKFNQFLASNSDSNNLTNNIQTLFGLPPVLFLCMIISAWWVAVSADLGHIRSNIDKELKKRQ